MQSARLALFTIFFIFIPITSYAESVKIIVKCSELEYIEVEKIPQGSLVPNFECKDGCFYTLYYMNDLASYAMISSYNAKKEEERELYLGNVLMFTMDPMDMDMPYTKKFSSGLEMYYSREEAIARSQQICPGVPVR